MKIILANEKLMPFVFAAISAAALGMALMSQYMFGLEPCILCIYQRWPFGLVIGLALIGYVLSYKNPKATAMTLLLISLSFLVNAGIAFYHTGVEQKWWSSFLEGCSVPQLEGNITDVLAQIKAAPVVRCDEIPWADPIFGLSMANYNVVFCLALTMLSFISAVLITRKANGVL